MLIYSKHGYSFAFSISGFDFQIETNGRLFFDVSDLDTSSTLFVEALHLAKRQRESLHAALTLLNHLEDFSTVKNDTESGLNRFAKERLFKHFKTPEMVRGVLGDLMAVANEQSIVDIPQNINQAIDDAAAHFVELQREARVELAKRFPTEHVGFVYLFKLSTGHYKIGYSNNPQRRGREIVSGLPLTIELIHQIPSNQITCLEAELHSEYADKRHFDTEWFLLSDSDVASVCTIEGRHYEWVNNDEWNEILGIKPKPTPRIFNPQSDVKPSIAHWHEEPSIGKPNTKRK